MARLGLKDICEYCGYPFGQGDHACCLKRLRRFHPIAKRDQVAVTRQVRLLSSVGWKRRELRTCPRCKTPHRWRSRECHAHTRKWCETYGGRLERGAKTAISKAEGAMR